MTEVISGDVHVCGVREEYSTLYSPQYWGASSRLQVGHADLEYRPENTLPFPVINFRGSDTVLMAGRKIG